MQWHFTTSKMYLKSFYHKQFRNIRLNLSYERHDTINKTALQGNPSFTKCLTKHVLHEQVVMRLTFSIARWFTPFFEEASFSTHQYLTHHQHTGYDYIYGIISGGIGIDIQSRQRFEIIFWSHNVDWQALELARYFSTKANMLWSKSLSDMTSYHGILGRIDTRILTRLLDISLIRLNGWMTSSGPQKLDCWQRLITYWIILLGHFCYYNLWDIWS